MYRECSWGKKARSRGRRGTFAREEGDVREGWRNVREGRGVVREGRGDVHENATSRATVYKRPIPLKPPTTMPTVSATKCFTILESLGVLLVSFILLGSATGVTVAFLIHFPRFLLFCSTFWCYYYIQNLPGLFIGVLVLIFQFPFTLLSMCLNARCFRRFKVAKCYQACGKTIIKHVLQHFLKAHDDEEEEIYYIVFNYRIPVEHMYWLSNILIRAFFVALIQFLNNLLFDESRMCSAEPSLDCFSTNSFNKLNCPSISDVEELTTVICYKFVFHVGWATGSAIGTITATSITIYLIILLLLKISGGKTSSYRCKWFTLVVQHTVASLVTIVTVVLGVSRIQTSSTLLAGLNSSVEIVTVGLIVSSSIGFFPWMIFRDKKKAANDYESI